LVREEDACALVADVMMLRAARGHDVTVAPENTVWLMRGAVVMLSAFGIGGREEDAAAFVVDVALTSPRPSGRGFFHETQPAKDTADD
jgi:hypothetical protein